MDLGPWPGWVGINLSAVGLNDATSNRHAKAGPLGLGGEEGIEDAPPDLGRQPRPIVAHGCVDGRLTTRQAEEIISTVYDLDTLPSARNLTRLLAQ